MPVEDALETSSLTNPCRESDWACEAVLYSIQHEIPASMWDSISSFMYVLR